MDEDTTSQARRLASQWFDTCYGSVREVAVERIAIELRRAEERARRECAEIARKLNAPHVAGAIGVEK